MVIHTGRPAVPLLCLFCGAITSEVSWRLQRLGVASSLPAVADWAAESVAAAVRQLLHEPARRDSVERWRDVMATFGGTRRATKLVEEVLDLGTEDLRSAETWLDVYAVYGAVLSGVAVIVRTLWSAMRSGWRKLTLGIKLD